jgi:hypothetical protein
LTSHWFCCAHAISESSLSIIISPAKGCILCDCTFHALFFGWLFFFYSDAVLNTLNWKKCECKTRLSGRGVVRQTESRCWRGCGFRTARHS